MTRNVHAIPGVHADAREARPRAAAVAILGVPFDNVTTAEAVTLIEEMIASRRPHYLVTANVDFLVLAMKDVELRRIMFDAHLVLCDGTPLLWASRLLGNPLPERVAGSDLVPLLIQVAAEKQYRIFFLGGSPDSAAAAVRQLQSRYPRLRIAGSYSPPFQPLLEMDHEMIRTHIERAQPDLLFVSFGAPKQEKFIAMHYRTLGVPVSVGVGGTIDFLSGARKRAPIWMRRTGLEWIFRMAQEPRRLAGRYAKDLCFFGGPLFAQWWRLRFRSARPPARPCMVPDESDEECRRIQLPEWFDMEAVGTNAALWDAVLADDQHCLVDLSEVRFIDSTGVGLLIRLHKSLRASGRFLVLVGESQVVQRALKSMRLERFFHAAPDAVSAKRMVARRAAFIPALAHPGLFKKSGLLAWRGEVTAANADDVWKTTEQFIRSASGDLTHIKLDLSAVRFIDSTGVGLMVRAKKAANREGRTLVFKGANADVRNVLRLCRLEAYLLEE